MKIKKLKMLSIAIFYIVFTLSSETQSAERRENERIEDSCSLWGISHWVSGIKEYTIDRCLLCGNDFNKVDPGRAYIIRSDVTIPGQYEIVHSTDCSCIHYCGCTGGETWETAFCPSPNGIIMGTLCCPLMTIMHILCFPFNCYVNSAHIYDYPTLEREKVRAVEEAQRAERRIRFKEDYEIKELKKDEKHWMERIGEAKDYGTWRSDLYFVDPNTGCQVFPSKEEMKLKVDKSHALSMKEIKKLEEARTLRRAQSDNAYRLYGVPPK